jgi:XTP/dITP diphosphohydrolase
MFSVQVFQMGYPKVIILILLPPANDYFKSIMNSIVFATNNLHKLNEVQGILKGHYRVLGLKDIGFTGEIPETGSTLPENASIKSWFVHQRFGMDCFSDDTGLEIDALGGRPGVYSSRYAGEEGNAAKNMRKVLSELEGEEKRTARFRTVISLILNGKEHFFEGIAEGKILTEQKGSGGFGYDPIFAPDGYQETFAEMPLKLKNSISHRGMAVTRLAGFLLDKI